MGFVHGYKQVIPLQARIFTLPPLYWPKGTQDIQVSAVLKRYCFGDSLQTPLVMLPWTRYAVHLASSIAFSYDCYVI